LFFNFRYYQLFDFHEAVAFIGQQMKEYYQAGIKIIKCGLHASEFVEKDMLGGYYHPAFRELCENHIYLSAMNSLIVNAIDKNQKIPEIFAVRPDCISKAVGQKKANVNYFQEKYQIKIKIIGDKNLDVYAVKSAEESVCI
jgi:hypothetical protein